MVCSHRALDLLHHALYFQQPKGGFHENGITRCSMYLHILCIAIEKACCKVALLAAGVLMVRMKSVVRFRRNGLSSQGRV